MFSIRRGNRRKPLEIPQIKALLTGLCQNLWGFLYPLRCASCGTLKLPSNSTHWCDTCLSSLCWIRSPMCPRCGRPFPSLEEQEDHLCEDCIQEESWFDEARSAVLYDHGSASRGILELKFSRRLYWAPILAELMEVVVRETEWNERVELLVPVPLHLRRLRSRGFNQSALLAKFLGKRIGKPVTYRVLERFRWTPPQTRLSRQKRLQNLKRAFRVTKPELIEGKAILLVDDVFTTGATLNECSRCLKEAGASRVFGITVARSAPDLGDYFSI